MGPRYSVEEEFREFVAARSAALLRTAYLLAGDWATAEDLLQTALTKTYLAWKRLGEIEAVEPYARRVLINTATSWWRRRWHGERPTEVLPERAAPDQIEEQLERDRLWRHVRTLPARQRAVLVLRFYEDMSEAQTAAMLNISPGTVKSQTSRALTTLRRRLGAEAGAEVPPAGRGLASVPAAAGAVDVGAVDPRAAAVDVGVAVAGAPVGVPRPPDDRGPAGPPPIPRPREAAPHRPAAALAAPSVPSVGAEC